jgi:hypothetical protein
MAYPWLQRLIGRLTALFTRGEATKLALPAAPVVAAEPIAAAPIAAAPVVAAPVVAAEPEPPVVVPPPPPPDRYEPMWRPVQLEPALARDSLRGFLRRLVAAGPVGLKIDLRSWQGVAVDRFFAAMTAPGLLRRHEPPTTGSEHLSLGNAFDGFEWE